MLDHIRAGESATLVLRGEAGMGKTALMRYCARQASGCRLAQISGVAAELEMPFAALHQLCAPMLEHLDTLPKPQQQAIQVAFGVAPGNAPDQFAVGLAVLGLLAEAATDRPLVCLVDDAQWLDAPSCRVLGFVGRRLLAEAVLLLLAIRETGDEHLLPALPTLTLQGLARKDAEALLAAAVPGQLDEQVRDRIVAETGGNPLGLLELSRAMSPAELAGGFGVPRAGSSTGQIEDLYAQRVRALPEPTRRLMLVAAADPTGDAALLWRASQTLGIGRSAAGAAESEQLLEIGARVRFRHPLVRSAAYAAATAEDRCAAHVALADATDARVDPERRVWHRASAVEGPDEAVAADLEQAAATAQARAGLAAAAAFLARASALTTEPWRRAERALAAAQAHLHAGAFEAALALLAEVDAVAVDELQRGRSERTRGQVEWASQGGREASVLLLQAAHRLEPLDVSLARETYLEAWLASFMAGSYARPEGLLPEVSKAARAAPRPVHAPRPCDLCLDGMATVVTDGRAAGAPSLRTAVDMFLTDHVSAGEWLQWGPVANTAACMLWDGQSWAQLSARHVMFARTSGALAPLSIALNGRGMFAAWCGDLDAASAIVAEESAIKEVTGIHEFSAAALMLAAYQGRQAEAPMFIAASAEASTARGQGLGAQNAHWMRAIFHNGHGEYAEALAAAEAAIDQMEVPNVTGWALVELIEACVRAGDDARARDALRQLSAYTLDDADWAAGVEARCRALIVEGDAAEDWYAEAVARLARTPLKTELARAHLLYGEWLRRKGRRVDARRQLGTAYDMFAAMPAEGFAERAHRELQATGEKVRRRHQYVDAHELTPQEEHVARLARDGRTNAEIGAELFLSIRTVEWHLGKVFTKLGITSRRGLKDALLRSVT
jgi:DNA-binding CsgD family transcriptional regulator